MKTIQLLAIVVTYQLVCPTSHAQDESAAFHLETVETSLGSFPSNGVEQTFVVSPDGRHIAYVYGYSKEVYISKDGIPQGGPYEEVALPGPSFSRSGDLFTNVVFRDGQWVPIVNGAEWEGFDHVLAPTTLSASGGHFAFGAVENGDLAIVIDRSRKTYKGASFENPGFVFSPDGDHCAYRVQQGDQWFVVVDGVVGTKYPQVDSSPVVFSPEGDRIAFIASSKRSDTNGGWMVVVDGAEGPAYETILRDSIVFTADGKNVAYIAGEEAGYRVVVNGAEGKVYDYVAPPATFSPDGMSVTYAARERLGQERWLFVSNGAEGEKYDSIAEDTTFSADRERHAFLAKSGGKWRVVVDGIEKPQHDEITANSFIFSPDGGRFAYVAFDRGKERIVVDDEEGKEYDRVYVNSHTFSPDGRRFAFAAERDGKHFIVADGVESKGYELYGDGSLCFSPDGNHVAYVVKDGGRWRILVDGIGGTAYDNHVRRPFITGFFRLARIAPRDSLFFDDDRHLHAIMVRGGNFLRVDVAIVPSSVPEADLPSLLDALAGHHWVRQETSAGLLDHPGIASSTVTGSQDRRLLSYVMAENDQWLVVVDGKKSRPFDAIKAPGPQFTPDGSRVVFAAESGGESLVVVGDVMGPEFDGIVASDLVFSRDGKHLAYAARVQGEPGVRSDEWVLVLDGEPGVGYDDGVGEKVFSPDGEHLAYMAKSGGKSFVVVDGVKGPEFDGIGKGIAFSPDGMRHAYAGVRGTVWYAVVDGELSGAYGGIGAMVFSSNSEHVAYVAASIPFEGYSITYVVVDGDKRGFYDEAGLAGLAFGLGDSTVLYDAALPGHHSALFRNKEEGPSFGWIADLTLSPDGKEVAYTAGSLSYAMGLSTAKRSCVVVGQTQGEYYEGIMSPGPHFSPDGTQVMYAAHNKHRWRVIVDGNEGREYAAIGADSLTFSPDGRRVAYSARRGENWLVVIDGVESELYDWVGEIFFSPSSEHTAFVSVRGDTYSVVIDGVEIGPYDGLVRGPQLAFDGERTLRALMFRDKEVLKVKFILED